MDFIPSGFSWIIGHGTSVGFVHFSDHWLPTKHYHLPFLSHPGPKLSRSAVSPHNLTPINGSTLSKIVNPICNFALPFEFCWQVIYFVVKTFLKRFRKWPSWSQCVCVCMAQRWGRVQTQAFWICTDNFLQQGVMKLCANTFQRGVNWTQKSNPWHKGQDNSTVTFENTEHLSGFFTARIRQHLPVIGFYLCWDMLLLLPRESSQDWLWPKTVRESLLSLTTFDWVLLTVQCYLKKSAVTSRGVSSRGKYISVFTFQPTQQQHQRDSQRISSGTRGFKQYTEKS